MVYLVPQSYSELNSWDSASETTFFRYNCSWRLPEHGQTRILGANLELRGSELSSVSALVAACEPVHGPLKIRFKKSSNGLIKINMNGIT